VEDTKSNISKLQESLSRLYNSDHQIPAHKSNELSYYEKKIKELGDILHKTGKPLNNLIHVYNQLKKRYHPAACVSAEERRRKRRVKENKRKCKKRKQQTILKNAHELANMITSTESGNRVADPDPLQITKNELSALNHTMLAPRKHLKPLKFLLEKGYFHDDARECILSIISVLEARKIRKQASGSKRKRTNEDKNLPIKTQLSLFDIFKSKNNETEKDSCESSVN
jgi:hypothetical protein